MFRIHSLGRSARTGKKSQFRLYAVGLLLSVICACGRDAPAPPGTGEVSGPDMERHDPPWPAQQQPDGSPTVPQAEGSRLLTAVREGDIETFQALLAQGTPVSAVDPTGRSALHWAALKGRSEFAKTLVESGADLEKTDRDGRTPLHLAARADAGSVIQSLLNAGAVADVRDNHGYLPVELASAYGLESESHALLEEAMVRLQEEPGRSAVRDVVHRYIEALKAGDAKTLHALSVPGTPEPPAELVKPQALTYSLQQTDLIEEGAVVVGTLELPEWLPMRFAMALKRCGWTWRVLGTSLWVE